MSLILPYDEKLFENGGAFVKKNGEMLYALETHERFARNYCNGVSYKLLSEVRNGTGESYYASHFDEFKERYSFEGSREDIDVYSTSMLTKSELALYKLWLETHDASRNNLYTDFMISILGFDKIQVLLQESITTTCTDPHVRFYNYYLMDWQVNELSPMAYNPETNEFDYVDRALFCIPSEEKEYEKEINEIRSRVLLKDRPLFFK